MVVLAGTRSDRSVVEELARIETDKWERQRKEKLRCQMKELTGKDPREGQVVALYHLLYGRPPVFWLRRLPSHHVSKYL